MWANYFRSTFSPANTRKQVQNETPRNSTNPPLLEERSCAAIGANDLLVAEPRHVCTELISVWSSIDSGLARLN
ncbi:hypothetical protein WN51_11187 [Melipona quadrifasciata]|uniref:Uncharacterized protein n=1 Tax=Melipona quadrifasciata TaxID=166423 RepID=A0A0M9A683_9HYME|nr:hypothetical protein WN51_11187 [Melipona quadrifasciata]